MFFECCTPVQLVSLNTELLTLTTLLMGLSSQKNSNKNCTLSMDDLECKSYVAFFKLPELELRTITAEPVPWLLAK